MFERKHEKLVPVSAFVARMAAHTGVVLLLIAGALSIGVVGYHRLAGFGWVDSLLNAAMILGGMGPVDKLPSVSAKLFASFYALFSGLVFIAVMGLVFAPIIHRVLHAFHMEDDGRS